VRFKLDRLVEGMLRSPKEHWPHHIREAYECMRESAEADRIQPLLVGATEYVNREIQSLKVRNPKYVFGTPTPTIEIFATLRLIEPPVVTADDVRFELLQLIRSHLFASTREYAQMRT
jgi:hypothetical protein